MKQTTTRLALSGLLATGLLAPATGSTQTQIPTTKQFFACYVPATGTVYLIKQPGLRSECASGHVQFSWSVGGNATAVTPAAVITDPDGWAATGTFGSGAIPVTGPGVRLMWYPRKAALRGGGVPTTQWDDANIGNYSVALGSGTTASAEAATALGRNTRASGQRAIATGAGSVASGFSSTAMGYTTTASGSISTALGNATTASSNFATAMGDHAAATSDAATAMGEGTTASGDASTAMGIRTTASGDFSTAMGDRTAATDVGSTAMGILTTASGSGSTAMGENTTASGAASTTMGTDASANFRTGSFVYGDRSAFATRTVVQATADNSFVVRATGGFRFRTAPDLSTGCDLLGGTLSCSGTSAFNGLRIVNTSPTGTERIDFIDATGSSISGIQVGNGSLSRMSVFNNRAGASVVIITGAQDRLTVNASGSVGIGTSGPSNILTVVQGSATAPIADAWTTYSSRRWKTDIERIEGALDRVRRLRGVSFTWKGNGKRDIGLIAEEVGEVVPEVVAYEDNSRDAKSVDYARLVAVLIEAVKEQQQQLDELRALVKSLMEGTEVSGRN
jgi:hypothetical protein